MARKGYKQEYRVKKMLQRQYGENAVIKVAIGSYVGDFIVIGSDSRVIKIVEVKKREGRLYFSKRERRQLDILKRIKDEFNIDVEYWIFSNRKLVIKKVDELFECLAKNSIDCN